VESPARVEPLKASDPKEADREAKTEQKTDHKKVILHPGEYHVSGEKVVISTLLGSCISVCLYDPVRRIVGMNHFLLSTRRYSKEAPICLTEAGRYGIHAMELMINGMFKLGADRKHLKAKVFGGSSFFEIAGRTDTFSCVGEVNQRFILEYLYNDGIPLVAKDLGGNRGRMIHFSSADYSVIVRKTRSITVSGLFERDRRLWLKSIQRQDRQKKKPDLWI
jgi:chemotaxis protein CheD